MKTWIVIEDARGLGARIAKLCGRTTCTRYHAWLDIADQQKAQKIVDAFNELEPVAS